ARRPTCESLHKTTVGRSQTLLTEGLIIFTLVMATSTKERSRQSITKVELDNSWFGFRTAYHLLGWVAVVVLLVFLDPQRERYTVGFEAIKVGVELIFCAGVI
ncbi:MAG: hypothetical protein AAF544_09785, partial [Bacteroidota bacterium]